jgi:asparagine synthase (glutamine-hydrolysing)
MISDICGYIDPQQSPGIQFATDQRPTTFAHLTMVMDGTVYNLQDIRKELQSKGHQFLSDSQQEVILHAFKEWGQSCVDRFIGMFAFAIYDEATQQLHLCRDRVGIKPLYYHLGHRFFAFSSVLKHLMAMPQFQRTISQEALSLFLKTNSISGELSIFENTFKLDAGHWATYHVATQQLTKTQYWNIEDYFALPRLQLSFHDAKDELKRLLKSSLSYCMTADTPVGNFLSSGVDSSVITALLSQDMGITPDVFTIGFDYALDEVPAARQIATILGARHFTRYCTEADALALVQRMPQVYDEPFGDPSAIPTQLAAQFAKEHAPVVLSADGGDHLFTGFNWHTNQIRLYNKLKTPHRRFHGWVHLPYLLAKAVIPRSKVIERSYLDILDGVFHEKTLNYQVLYDNQRTKYQSLVNTIFPAARAYDCRQHFRHTGTVAASSPDYTLLSDFKFSMKDEILMKMERATRAISLEAREPILDHRIAEFAAQLPWDYKYQDHVRKRLLRSIAHDYVPKELIDHPKRGFGPPTSDWMRGCLKPMMHDLLTKNNLEEMGFSVSQTSKLLNFFMKGEGQTEHVARLVWNIFQYSLWYNHWMKLP